MTEGGTPSLVTRLPALVRLVVVNVSFSSDQILNPATDRDLDPDMGLGQTVANLGTDLELDLDLGCPRLSKSSAFHLSFSFFNPFGIELRLPRERGELILALNLSSDPRQTI